MTETVKELLVLANPSRAEISILVPKRRGTGFVKVPFGHHANKALGQIEDEIGYDIYGLDGCLEVNTGYFFEEKEALLEKIMPPISKHYGMPWRELSEEDWWSHHPFLAHRVLSAMTRKSSQ